ncbi:addiction module antidote protein [Polaromonas jejuensis]|uniref:Addiction module antidote protein n=1 Tax=Polaromonas jejuensis TaxID=457502 RepID=A0ABW0QH52_9BURK
MRNDNPLGLKPFDEAEYLTDEKAIAEYLNAAAEMGDPAVLLDAFAVVGRARGMAELARKAGLGRESLYKALAPGAHPRYDTIFRVAQALGVNFHFAAPEDVRTPRKKVSAPAKTLRRTAAKKLRRSHGAMSSTL